MRAMKAWLIPGSGRLPGVGRQRPSSRPRQSFVFDIAAAY